MKKSRIKQIVREVLTEEKGYSKYIDGGKTDGLTQDTLEKILLKIAKQGEEIEEEKYEGDPERGNKILDTADQDNIDRILKGEDPIYEVDRMQELAGIQKEIKVNNPTNPNLKYKPLLNKYKVDEDWLLLHLGDIDDLTPEEWDDLEFVEDRIIAHLSDEDGYDGYGNPI